MEDLRLPRPLQRRHNVSLPALKSSITMYAHACSHGLPDSHRKDFNISFFAIAVPKPWRVHSSLRDLPPGVPKSLPRFVAFMDAQWARSQQHGSRITAN